jgi:hypothetical protein
VRGADDIDIEAVPAYEPPTAAEGLVLEEIEMRRRRIRPSASRRSSR